MSMRGLLSQIFPESLIKNEKKDVRRVFRD